MRFLDELSEGYIFPEAGCVSDAENRMEEFCQLTRYEDKKLEQFVKEITTHATGSKLLNSIFGNSPYLSRIIIKDPLFLAHIAEHGVQKAFEQVKQELDETPVKTMPELMRLLRVAKRRVSLLIAVADITGYWPLAEVTAYLSEFADKSLTLATDFLLREAAAKKEIILEDAEHNPSQGSGLIVLGMGKLGGYELNYSSDVDIILFYNADKVNYIGNKTMRHLFVDMGRDLIKIMSERTADGYVFRMDLRLRPDPASTPIAMPINAALIYYESVGQNWERMAMIKARPVAGDMEAGEAFIHEIRPFIWRKYLDFASIEDIHSVKRQIESKHGKIPDDLKGYNIKLGRGGIREIEFFVGIQQLIWGGREVTVRIPPTCKGLAALVACGKTEENTAIVLEEAYNYLRKLEHRLQMVNDQQTHSLPESDIKMQELSIFMGYKDTQEMVADLRGKLKRVQKHYGELYGDAPSLTLEDVGGSLVFTGTDPDPETVKNLEAMGFSNGEAVSEIIRGWHHGRNRATNNKRARELLTELMPSILKAFSETAHPYQAFIKFDQFLANLPAGVQLFSLFAQNIHLLDIIAEAMGSYPYLAKTLSRKPRMLEYVLSEDFLDPLMEKGELKDRIQEALSMARDYEDVLDIARRWAHDRQFRIGVQLIKKIITPAASRNSLSDIAEVVLYTLLAYAEEEFAKKHGKIPEGKFVIVAMGKLGSHSLCFGSDIDLVFIYDAPDEGVMSDGEAGLTISEYYSRLSRRYISAFSAMTMEGRLYEIDMRLRPSGNDGPVASNLEAFSQYYDSAAWVWEYMALTRARVIAGDSELKERAEQVIHKKLTLKWEKNKLVAHILDIRERIDRQYGTEDPWDIKYVRGGLIDVEFIAQFLQLLYASVHPDVLDPATGEALRKLGGVGVVDKKIAIILQEANGFFLDLQSILRMASGDVSDRFIILPGIKEELIRLRPEKSFEELEKLLLKTQEKVRKYFDKIISV